MKTTEKTRRLDGRLETAADRRFLDLRESGYQGPIDQDGHAAASIWPDDDTDIDLALDEPIDVYSPNRWTGAVYKVLATLTVPVLGTLVSEMVGAEVLTWLFLALSLLGVAACFGVLVLERRADLR